LRHQNQLDIARKETFGLPHHVQEAREQTNICVVGELRGEWIRWRQRKIFEAANAQEQNFVLVLKVQLPVVRIPEWRTHQYNVHQFIALISDWLETVMLYQTLIC